MIDKLKNIVEVFPRLLVDAVKAGTVKTMYINYERPFVSRLWFPFDDLRIFLHKIEATDSLVYFHPHKWESAMTILHGSYEMGIGHSETNETPNVDCKLILQEGSIYEMVDKNAWHYVKPIGGPCYTLMVTGKLNGREMPIESSKEHRHLDYDEIFDLLGKYGWDMDSPSDCNLVSKILGK